MTSAAPAPIPGASVGEGRYAITRLIGEGAQGQTLEAIDKRDGTLVAVKRFSVRGAASWKDVELAEREARVLAQLSHPALPKHLAHFEEDGALYLVMTLVEGDSLAVLRRRGELLDVSQVCALLEQLSEVLGYLARRSPPVIHRDIKPNNVVRRADGSFALVDFGSVRDQLKPEGSTVVGTFGYMAPEQFQGRALPVSDIYGLGATALTLLTGVEPDQQPHRGLAIDVAKALGPSADRRLVRLLRGMLAPDPDVRLTDLTSELAALRADAKPDYWSTSSHAESNTSTSKPKTKSAETGSPREGTAEPRQTQPGRARPFAPPFILVLFGAGFWFSSSATFRVLLPLISLTIAVAVWLYMSGGLKLQRFQQQVGAAGKHHARDKRARVRPDDDGKRYRVVDTNAEELEEEPPSNSSGKNRRSV